MRIYGLSLAMVCCFLANCYGQICTNGVCSRQTSVNLADYNLAPGEVLVSVNGVPVSNMPARPIVNAVKNVGQAIGNISSRVINRNHVAFDHALREAQILADRRGSGHPLGVAPGCRYAGTGTSFSPEFPNHCYKELPESRLVARAVVRGNDGRFYWSAHYR